MRKHLLTLVVAAGIAGATVMHPGRVEARCHGCWVDTGVAIDLLAGAAFGYPAYGYGYPPYGYGYDRPVYSGGPYYAYSRPRYSGYYGPRYRSYGPRYYARPYRYYY